MSTHSKLPFTQSHPLTPSQVPKLLYSRKDAAFAISISIRSLDMLLAAGKIAVRKIGKRIMIPAEALFEFAGKDHDALTQDFNLVDCKIE